MFYIIPSLFLYFFQVIIQKIENFKCVYQKFRKFHPVVWWYPIEISNFRFFFVKKSSFKIDVSPLYIYLGRFRVKLSTFSRCFDFLFVGRRDLESWSFYMTSWNFLTLEKYRLVAEKFSNFWWNFIFQNIKSNIIPISK